MDKKVGMSRWLKIFFIIVIIAVILVVFLFVYRYSLASGLMAKSYNEAKAGNIGYAEFLMNVAVKLVPSNIVSYKLGLAVVLTELGNHKESSKITVSLFSENVGARGLLYMGDALYQNKDFELALGAYNKSRFSKDNDGFPNLNERAFIGYARILIMQNKSSEVLPELVRLSTQGLTPLIQNQSSDLVNSLKI
jgi:hypothetical protein